MFVMAPSEASDHRSGRGCRTAILSVALIGAAVGAGFAKITFGGLRTASTVVAAVLLLAGAGLLLAERAMRSDAD